MSRSSTESGSQIAPWYPSKARDNARGSSSRRAMATPSAASARRSAGSGSLRRAPAMRDSSCARSDESPEPISTSASVNMSTKTESEPARTHTKRPPYPSAARASASPRCSRRQMSAALRNVACADGRSPARTSASPSGSSRSSRVSSSAPARLDEFECGAEQADGLLVRERIQRSPAGKRGVVGSDRRVGYRPGRDVVVRDLAAMGPEVRRTQRLDHRPLPASAHVHASLSAAGRRARRGRARARSGGHPWRPDPR